MPKPSDRPFPTRLAIMASGAALLAAAFAAYLTPSRSGAPLIGGPFALQMADGKTLTNKDLLGHPYLVYFGYTHCPDVCPTTLAQISDVLRKLPGKPVKALFITVDPDRDSAKTMGDYVSSFDPRVIGLSGTPAEIGKTEKEFRVYSKKAPEKDGDYSMDHTSVVYLMDRNGRFAEAFNLERSADESAKELATYL
ncbi:MAG TPA: SCO family protein [Roseiarcus sp.]|nr:SCO family protein [Roseiarcus sp.]